MDGWTAQEAKMEAAIVQAVKALNTPFDAPGQSPTLEEVAEHTGIPIDDARDAVERLVLKKALEVFRRPRTGMAMHPIQVKLAK